MSGCWCGRETATEHPCHWGGLTCPEPGAAHAYAKVIGRFQHSGTPKVVPATTWLCDQHWREFAAQPTTPRARR